MKIRTIYLRVTNMNDALRFWKGFLEREPIGESWHWTEFMLDNVRLALIYTEGGRDGVAGSNCVPILEYSNDEEVAHALERAQSLGATLTGNKLDDPVFREAYFLDPSGNQFQITRFRGSGHSYEDTGNQ